MHGLLDEVEVADRGDLDVFCVGEHHRAEFLLQQTTAEAVASASRDERLMSETTVDYQGLLRANLERVFGEKDARKRVAAILELYAPDAVVYEPHHIASGHAEIISMVEGLLGGFPPEFVFAADGPAVGHHGLGRLRWRVGPPEGPAAATGTDVVQIEANRIKAIHVFLDPPAS